MDTFTHVALGACIGEVAGAGRLGKKALIWGAGIQLIPDLDVLLSLSMDPSSNVLAHRGFTHSLLFTILISLLLAWFFTRRSGMERQAFRFWLIFLSLEIFTHILLDSFNAYGTGWFEPFSHYRVSFHTLYVIDPFYAFPLGIGCALLFVWKVGHKKRVRVAWAAIFVSTFYLGYGIVNKMKVEVALKKAIADQDIKALKHFTTPTPFNCWLWYVVVSDESGYHVSYRSVFDRGNAFDFEFFPRRDSLLAQADNQEDARLLKRFSQGFYTVESRGDTLTFNDLRFGQVAGWNAPGADFVFHYYLHPAIDNKLVMQRGRFSGWNRATLKSLSQRIRGN